MSRHLLTPRRALVALPAGLVTLTIATAVQAQDANYEEDVYVTDTVTVTATRTTQGRPLSSIPGSVTVIQREQIAEQAAISGDLGSILTKLVPGLGPTSESLTNFGQELRGRDFLVLIDGVPQTTPLRKTEKALRTIDPSAIERIEVIRGAVATYGFGATGGIINIITRSGDDGGPRFRTELGATGSMTHFDDSLGGSIYQGVSGGGDKLDYSVNLSAQTRGGFFDPDGERIAPDAFAQGGGFADSGEYNAQTKLGYQLTEDQRLRLSANYYRIEQDTDHSLDSNPDDPAFAVEEEPRGVDPGIENLTVSLDHTAEDVLGGTLSSQLYYQDYETIFSFFDGVGGPFQSKTVSEKIGARFAHERSFLGDSNVVYGIDFLHAETSQPLVEGGFLAPELEQFSYAPFVQLEVPVGQSWLLRGGVRHERVNVKVDDFSAVYTAGPVEGGELDFSETVYNLGAVYFLSDNQELFAGFSQGFTIADLGRILGRTSASSIEGTETEAQVVDNYEIGWRGYFDRFSGSISLFYNTSDLGTSYGSNLQLIRQEEEIYGIEIAADYRVTEAWTMGGTLAWQEGKADTDEDGDLDAYLPATRISPPKLTLYGEYEPSDRWSARLQLTHFEDRDRDDYSALFGATDIQGYTVVDAYVSMGVGPGRLSLGIGNLLNEDYITTLGQIYDAFGEAIGNRTFYQAVPGRGRHFSLQYALRY